MKKLGFILSLIFCVSSFAGSYDELTKALLAQGYSSGDVEIIVKTVEQTAPQVFRMKKGTVKFFNEAKGFGRIIDENNNEFVIESQSKLKPGDSVIFDVQEGKKGLNAVNVKLA